MTVEEYLRSLVPGLDLQDNVIARAARSPIEVNLERLEVDDDIDDYDDDERSFTRLNQNTFVFEGKTLLTDFTRTLKLDDEYFEQVQGEPDTLAGLLLEIKGDFPELHEKIAYRRCSFEVMELDERRIVSIKVILKPASEQGES